MNAATGYRTLGLDPDASWDEVKTAFRRLARTYHPDVAGPRGARRFAEITEAYMSLKDVISSEAQPYSARQEEDISADSGGQSFLKRVWSRFASRADARGEEEKETAREYASVSAARVRFIGGAISRAESQIAGLLSRREEVKGKNRTGAIICRLRSKHPAVVMLALRQISYRDAGDEIRAAALEHFTKNIPATEVLVSLLSLFTGSREARGFMGAIASHARRFSSSDAQIALRWLRQQNADKSCFTPFLSHPSHAVAAAALGAWPPSFGLPETSDVANLLKTDDEAALVALLRLLRREGAPAWTISQITRISSEHASSAVRVWASAIVRDRKVS